MNSKIQSYKMWEKDAKVPLHSPEDIDRLRTKIKAGLMKKYESLAVNMWEYDFPEEFDDMLTMSQNTAPESVLFRNGNAVAFYDEATEQYHVLPVTVKSGGINMYGKPAEWNPVPVGSSDSLTGNNEVFSRFTSMNLNSENSVWLKNDFSGTSDMEFIEVMVEELVDNLLTVNQLQLLSRMPLIFGIEEEGQNLMSAKNMYLQIAQGAPVTYVTKSAASDLMPEVADVRPTIDSNIFDIFDRWECLILEQLGIDCVPISKREQQSVREVESNDDKLRLRRLDKLRQREKDWERFEKIFGVHVKVHSVIDEDAEKQQMLLMSTMKQSFGEEGSESNDES